MIEYEWSPKSRCPCCRKFTPTVLGPLCNETAPGWDNLFGVGRAEQLAREGLCPWCGRRTTTPAHMLLEIQAHPRREYAGIPIRIVLPGVDGSHARGFTGRMRSSA